MPSYNTYNRSRRDVAQQFANDRFDIFRPPYIVSPHDLDETIAMEYDRLEPQTDYQASVVYTSNIEADTEVAREWDSARPQPSRIKTTDEEYMVADEEQEMLGRYVVAYDPRDPSHDEVPMEEARPSQNVMVENGVGQSTADEQVQQRRSVSDPRDERVQHTQMLRHGDGGSTASAPAALPRSKGKRAVSAPSADHTETSSGEVSVKSDAGDDWEGDANDDIPLLVLPPASGSRSDSAGNAALTTTGSKTPTTASDNSEAGSPFPQRSSPKLSTTSPDDLNANTSSAIGSQSTTAALGTQKPSAKKLGKRKITATNSQSLNLLNKATKSVGSSTSSSQRSSPELFAAPSIDHSINTFTATGSSYTANASHNGNTINATAQSSRPLAAAVLQTHQNNNPIAAAPSYRTVPGTATNHHTTNRNSITFSDQPNRRSSTAPSSASRSTAATYPNSYPLQSRTNRASIATSSRSNTTTNNHTTLLQPPQRRENIRPTNIPSWNRDLLAEQRRNRPATAAAFHAQQASPTPPAGLSTASTAVASRAPSLAPSGGTGTSPFGTRHSSINPNSSSSQRPTNPSTASTAPSHVLGSDGIVRVVAAPPDRSGSSGHGSSGQNPMPASQRPVNPNRDPAVRAAWPWWYRAWRWFARIWCGVEYHETWAEGLGTVRYEYVDRR